MTQKFLDPHSVVTHFEPQLQAAKAAIERAVKQFNSDKQRLFTFDGKPINDPTTHAREIERLLADVTAAVDKAREVASLTEQEIELLRLNDFQDPTIALSLVDLEDANRRVAFVREDCEALPLATLRERVRWAAQQTGTRPSLPWLYGRYATRRWQTEEKREPQDPALGEFGQVLREIGVLGPKAGLSPAAQKLAEDAQQLKRYAARSLNDAQAASSAQKKPMGL